MKPMIMYVEVKDGNVTMTKEMFEKYINEAYPIPIVDLQPVSIVGIIGK